MLLSTVTALCGGHHVLSRMGLRVREMTDLLGTFPLHRRAAIVRRHVCRPAWESGAPPGIGRYRSSEDIRVVIAADDTTSCPPRFTLDKGELPGPFKRPSRQRLYDVLVENFGAMCVACGNRYGQVIDHDHVSGLIRGLVCRDCNQVVERCLHSNSLECGMANYLNAPPALDLQIRYPARHRQRAIDDVRQAILGFDVFDQSRWPSPDPTEWRWTVPDESTLMEVENDWWRRHPNAPELRRSPNAEVEPCVLVGS